MVSCRIDTRVVRRGEIASCLLAAMLVGGSVRAQEADETPPSTDVAAESHISQAMPLTGPLVVTPAPDLAVAPLATTDAATADGTVAPLPTPVGLEPAVTFWRRVYTEVGSNEGFLHDSRHLDVVYDTVRVPQNLTRRGVSRYVKAQAHAISAILQTLAHGKRADLSEEEARVLGLWPEGVSNETLAQAAQSVRFQTGQKDKFVAGILRSRIWMPHIVETFAAHGLPRELAALPHVESSFDLRAYSRVRAAGIWQFMPATGRHYMKVNNTVDERFDPILATEAAAKLLTYYHQRTGAWPLAITSYNHGVEGMRRAMKTLDTTDIMEVIAKCKRRSFGFASRNFYAELLAAWEVSQHAEKYFGPLPQVETPAYQALVTDAFYPARSVAAALGMKIDALKELNPALRTPVWNGSSLIPKGFALRLPKGAGETVALLERLALIPRGERYASAEGRGAVRMPKNRTVAQNTTVPVKLNLASPERPGTGATSSVNSSMWYPSAPAPISAPWDSLPAPLKN